MIIFLILVSGVTPYPSSTSSSFSSFLHHSYILISTQACCDIPFRKQEQPQNQHILFCNPFQFMALFSVCLPSKTYLSPLPLFPFFLEPSTSIRLSFLPFHWECSCEGPRWPSGYEIQHSILSPHLADWSLPRTLKNDLHLTSETAHSPGFLHTSWAALFQNSFSFLYFFVF